MRRFLLFAFLTLALWMPLPAAEIAVAGALVPQDVYVGDEALLTAELPPLIQGVIQPGESVVIPPLQGRAEGVTIRGGELSRDADGAYRLELRFTPWEPGPLVFPPISVPGTDLVLNIAPVTIASLSEKLGETRLRPVRPPEVVPGTTYLLLGAIAALVLIISLTVAALVKGDALRRRFAAHLGSLVFSRAGRRTLRFLAAFGKKSAAMSAPDFAALMERHLRFYLEKRFCRPFTAMTSPELSAAFSAIFGIAADSFLDEQVTRLQRIFLRCDFLRYSASVDCLPLTEGRELVAEAIAVVTAFERGPH
jgi:hypothetical protein